MESSNELTQSGVVATSKQQPMTLSVYQVMQLKVIDDLSQREKDPIESCDLYNQVESILRPVISNYIVNWKGDQSTLKDAEHVAREIQFRFISKVLTKNSIRLKADTRQQEKQDELISSIIHHCLTLLVASATDVPFGQAVIVKRIIEIVQFTKNLPKNMTYEELFRLAENNHISWLRNLWDDDDDEDDLESLVENTLSANVETQTDLSSAEYECLEAENKALKEQLRQMEREMQGLKEKLSVSEQENAATASSDTDDNDTQGEEEESRDSRGLGEENEQERPSSRSSNSEHDQQELDFIGGGDGGFSSEESSSTTDQEEDDDASVSTTDQHDDNQETCKHCGMPLPQDNLEQDNQITLHVNNLKNGKQVWEVECGEGVKGKGKDVKCGATTVATQHVSDSGEDERIRASCPCFVHDCKGKKPHGNWTKKKQLKSEEDIVKAWRKRMRMYDAAKLRYRI